MNKHLVGCICTETRNASLNGSSDKVEHSSIKYDNISFTKKITINGEKFPYASGCQTSSNILRFLESRGHSIAKAVSVSTTESSTEGHPAKNTNEDLKGFMNACNEKVKEEDYNQLPDNIKKLYSKKNKKDTEYVRNVTKKRKACLQLSPLQAITATRIQIEFGIHTTDKTSIPFNKEVYGGYMSYGFNLNLTEVGRFKVSADASGFRDYSPEEIETYGLKPDSKGIILLDKETRFKRVSDTLRAMQYYNSTVRQTNNLEDLTTKFVILGEYSIGNNLFNNIFRNGELDTDYLMEAISENEEFRLSPIFIGRRTGFMPEAQEKIDDMVKKLTALKIDVRVGTVKEAFDKYIDFLQNTLE